MNIPKAYTTTFSSMYVIYLLCSVGCPSTLEQIACSVQFAYDAKIFLDIFEWALLTSK